MLRVNRFAEQVTRSIQELARHPEDPNQFWRATRVQLGPFSVATRKRMHQGAVKPNQYQSWRWERPPPLQDVVMINGNWSRPTWNGGMTRLAGSFPRVQIHARVERSLTHKATMVTTDGRPQVMRDYYSCVIDEYRTSKAEGKLGPLMADGRTDRTKPKADSLAWTTDVKNGQPKSFKVHKSCFKILQSIGRDGQVHVANRDETTVNKYAAIYVAHREKKPNLPTLSRTSTKAAQSSVRSRMARTSGSAP